MDNLEHRIKNAFESNDKKTSFAGKEHMWSRLYSGLHGRKGVAAFWRIAAVFLGLFLTLGVVASLNNRAKQYAEMENVNHEIIRLQLLVDSLQTLPTEVRTEVKVIEKERVVYREKEPGTTAPDVWKARYLQNADSFKVIQQQNAQFRLETEAMQNELLALKQKTAKEANTAEEQKSNPFELKSDRVELGIRKKPMVKSPEMEMKVFQKNFIENKNNLNSTIFKK